MSPLNVQSRWEFGTSPTGYLHAICMPCKTGGHVVAGRMTYHAGAEGPEIETECPVCGNRDTWKLFQAYGFALQTTE